MIFPLVGLQFLNDSYWITSNSAPNLSEVAIDGEDIDEEDNDSDADSEDSAESDNDFDSTIDDDSRTYNLHDKSNYLIWFQRNLHVFKNKILAPSAKTFRSKFVVFRLDPYWLCDGLLLLIQPIAEISPAIYIASAIRGMIKDWWLVVIPVNAGITSDVW